MDFKTGLKKRDAISAITLIEKSGFQARLAGGCVRDLLLGKNPSDFDVATTSNPKKTIDIFKKHQIKTVPTGIEHGTITAVYKSGPIEITTLRSDDLTDGRHAQVSFSDSWEDDASRRDFTVNALYEDKDGKVYDFNGGIEDLNKKQLCFVGDAHKRIQEDYLRILRFFRFKAQLGFSHDVQLEEAITKNLAGITLLSQERVTSEIRKLFGFRFVEDSSHTMVKTQAFDKIFFPIENFAADRILQKLESLGGVHANLRFLVRLFYIWSQNQELSNNKLNQLCKQWKLSNEDLKIMVLLFNAKYLKVNEAEQSQVMEDIDAFDVISLGKHEDFISPFFEACMELFETNKATYQKLLKMEALKGHIRRKKIPIDGKTLIDLGIEQGPQLGEVLKFLRYSYRDELWENKSEGIEYLKLNGKL